ncbi:BON domain-containing protein [Psychrosphaera sp.]|nr:BON domain-containing protein [Psychrosphaera sp.]
MNKLTKTLSAVAVIGALGLSSQAEANDWKDKSKDAWIDGKAETVLLMNTNLNSFDINTDVKKGVVILTGKVDSNVERDLAEELIESLDGVNSVENELTVMNEDKSSFGNTMMDAKVATVLETKFLLESEVSATDIDIEAENGVVKLSGMVSSDAEHDLAIAIAKNTDDVKRVIDELEVTEE